MQAARDSAHRRIAAFLAREFRLVLPPTIFFAVGFNLIVLTQHILLADYLIRFAGFTVATVTALVVGKAVLIAHHVPFLRRYDNAPLILPILYKTAIYWAVVFVVRLLEAYFRYAVSQGALAGFIPYLQDRFVWRHFAFVQIWILVLFLIYTTGAELNHLFGDGELRRILFRHRSSAVKQTRRQRIRTLVRLDRLADDTTAGEFTDPNSRAHKELLDLIGQLRGDSMTSAPRGDAIVTERR